MSALGSTTSYPMYRGNNGASVPLQHRKPVSVITTSWPLSPKKKKSRFIKKYSSDILEHVRLIFCLTKRSEENALWGFTSPYIICPDPLAERVSWSKQ